MPNEPGKSIDKKESIAEKLSALGRGVFRGADPRSPALGSGPPNKDGKPRLPVGQHEVKNWPVLDLGLQPEITHSQWKLALDGLCDRPQVLTWEKFQALPHVEDTSDFHCVTTWSRFENHWKGVRFRDLALLAGVRPEARFVLTTGSDYDPRTGEHYTTNLSLERAVEDDVLLVDTWEGRPLPREHGGPVRMITPKLYAWKGAKWIEKITFLAADHPGFWEVRGYSNTAEPWANDRYS
ncbi:molybdopterin-dependent oxidoreductase [bacterium]|nr:molybdopterin-dependent oxidoreductase [bacterium]